MLNIRVYADISVFGGVYDDDFQNESEEFLKKLEIIDLP